MLRRRHEAIAPRLRSKTTGKEESRERRRIKIYHRSGSPSAVALCGSPVWRSVSAGILSGSLSAVALCGSQPWRITSAGIRSGSLSAVALCGLSVGCRPLPVCEALQRAGVRRVVFRPAVVQRSPRVALRRALVQASRGSGGSPSHLPNRWVCRRIGNWRHWLAP